MLQASPEVLGVEMQPEMGTMLYDDIECSEMIVHEPILMYHF